jgi:hypothetical protein
MTAYILVLLKRHDRMQEIMPYFEKIAQPGMKVVFLVPYPVDPREWWRGRRLSIEAEVQTRLAVRIVEKYPWETQRRLAEERVFSACKALQRRGVTVAVDVYAGPLRKALRAYTVKGDLHLIMIRAGISFRIGGFLRGMIPIFALFKCPSFPAVLLLRPAQGA